MKLNSLWVEEAEKASCPRQAWRCIVRGWHQLVTRLTESEREGIYLKTIELPRGIHEKLESRSWKREGMKRTWKHQDYAPGIASLGHPKTLGLQLTPLDSWLTLVNKRLIVLLSFSQSFEIPSLRWDHQAEPQFRAQRYGYKERAPHPPPPCP